MNHNHNFSNYYNQLISENSVQIRLGGSDINVRLQDKERMSLTASVYEGGNYIPESVRKCVGGKVPFDGWIPTRLIIEEDKYQIVLDYNESIQADPQILKDLLEEFSWQADEWRLYLEEHDKRDLVYIYARR